MNQRDMKNESSKSQYRIKIASQPTVQPWLGLDVEAESHDGVVFSGVRALTKPSLTDCISHWIEAIFRHGEEAYGVGENPTSRARKRRDRTPKPTARQQSGTIQKSQGPVSTSSVFRSASKSNAAKSCARAWYTATVGDCNQQAR